MRRALVTIVIGELYTGGFARNVYPEWKNYAIKWGYDIVVIDSPIDTSERANNRSIAWQKCLICEYPLLKSYDRIVWLDADILINPQAPDILNGIPPESVGAVPALLMMNLLQRQDSETDKENRRAFHTEFGLPGTFDTIVQTGVLVLSPQHHATTLRHVYDQWEDKGGSHWNFEMRPLSYELQARHPIHWLDSRFNVVWVNVRENFFPFLRQEQLGDAWEILGKMNSTVQILLLHECIKTCLQKSYFLHFAGTKFYELPFSDPNHTQDLTRFLVKEAGEIQGGKVSDGRAK